MTDENNWGQPSQMGFLPIDTHIAFSAKSSFSDAPAFYRRTWLLGIAFGPLIAAVAGLCDYDADVWCWSKAEGFKAVKLKKRGK